MNVYLLVGANGKTSKRMHRSLGCRSFADGVLHTKPFIKTAVEEARSKYGLKHICTFCREDT